MAVFDAPPVPACGPGGEVIRIVDPLGLQVAWVAPALAGGIVGYYVREVMGDGWTEVLTCSAGAGREAGTALLLRDGQSGQMMPVPATRPSWTFASRDPTQVTVSGRVDDHAVSVSLQCADGELHIEVEPGAGQHRLPDLGLRLVLGSAVGELGAETTDSGELDFHGGVLSHLTLLHSPGLAYQVHPGPGGDHQIDLLPDPTSSAANPPSPVSITLIPRPSPTTPFV
jgi:hypothetical protein